jgi:hypothetical protein
MKEAKVVIDTTYCSHILKCGYMFILLYGHTQAIYAHKSKITYTNALCNVLTQNEISKCNFGYVLDWPEYDHTVGPNM